MLPYLLIVLFYIGMPVVRTDGLSGGGGGVVGQYGHVITKFSRMGRLLHYPYGGPLARVAHKSSATNARQDRTHTHKFLKKIHQAGKVDIYIKCSQIIAKKRLNDADSFALPVSHLYQN